MKLRDHESRAAVRKHLIDNGFVDAFTSPGRPELWLKPGSPKLRYAVQRERSDEGERWHIIPYPEPSVCSSQKVRELAARDGVLLNGPQKKEEEFGWLD